MIKLRNSPSGPVIATLNSGFPLATYRRSIATDEGKFLIPPEGIQFGFGPGTPPEASILIVPVSAQFQYAASLAANFQANNFDTSILQIEIQYSNNAGAQWLTLANNRTEVLGLQAAPESWPGMFRLAIETAPVLGAALLPSLNPGNVWFRGTCQWEGTPSQGAIWWNTGENLGTTQLNVSEEIA